MTSDLLELRRMTPKEYELRLIGAMLRRVDSLEMLAYGALFNRKANATNDKGEYLVKRIEDIYNAKKAASEITGSPEKDAVFGVLYERMKRQEEFRQRKRSG